MDSLKAKRLRHFLRLSYPVLVVATQTGFRGRYPDLPGCAFEHDDVSEMYAALERLRREWLTEHVLTETEIPLPNAHLRRDRITAEYKLPVAAVPPLP